MAKTEMKTEAQVKPENVAVSKGKEVILKCNYKNYKFDDKVALTDAELKELNGYFVEV